MDPARDAFWDKAVKAAGIEVFKQLTISKEALAFILPSLEEGTSRRRLRRHRGAAEPQPRSVEQD